MNGINHDVASRIIHKILSCAAELITEASSLRRVVREELITLILRSAIFNIFRLTKKKMLSLRIAYQLPKVVYVFLFSKCIMDVEAKQFVA